MHVIYKIVNNIDGKLYIGKTNNPTRRKRRHFSELRTGKHSNSYLQRAWDKYGEKSFEFILIESDESLDEILRKEIFWITFYGSIDPAKGYNLTSGGEDNKLSELSLKKLSASLTGRTLSPEHRLKIGEANKGKIVSLDTRAKITKKSKERYEQGLMPYLKPTFYSGEDHGMYGKTHTSEVKKQLSLARLGKTYEEIFGAQVAAKIKHTKSENSKGIKNPFYKAVDIDLVKEKLDNGEKVCDISRDLKVSRQTILKKFKEKYYLTITEYLQK
jgi:group I intron endonuclease